VDAVNVNGVSAAGLYSCIKFHLSIEIHLHGEELYIISATPNSMPNSMPPDSSVHLPPESPPVTLHLSVYSLLGNRTIILS